MVAMAVFLAVNPCIAAELPSVGDLPPALALPDLNGKIVNLSDFHGKPIVLTFFVSWSKTCKDQLGSLQELSSKYPHNLEIIAVSLDKKVRGIRELAGDLKLNYNLLMDKKLASLKQYAILSLPTSIVIGSDGKIKGVYVDYDDNVKRSIDDFARSEISPAN